jgi:hypothetical protein
MTKEEAWLAWMKAAKTNGSVGLETDFDIIKKTSWWEAFEAGWDLASVNLNGWDQAYAMGLEAGKQVRTHTPEDVQKITSKWDVLDSAYPDGDGYWKEKR